MNEVFAGNLLAGLPDTLQDEVSSILVSNSGIRIERIVSHGQASPDGMWYDQQHYEWVLLVSGGAAIFFEGETSANVLKPGDYLLIPPHCRHRVAWTDPLQHTVWLAVHFGFELTPG